MKSFIGEVIQVLFGLSVLFLICRWFLMRTWIGKTIMLLIKTTIEFSKFAYFSAFKLYKFANKMASKQKPKHKKEKQPSQSEKKVANGNNVIQFQPKGRS